MKFHGIAASKGQATGRACIVDNADDFAHCTEESIAVVVKIKPTAALMKKIRGIVGVYGGVTSHAAIVAREHGKPAVVGLTENFLAQVKNGDDITINADAGDVEILET